MCTKPFCIINHNSPPEIAIFLLGPFSYFVRMKQREKNWETCNISLIQKEEIIMRHKIIFYIQAVRSTVHMLFIMYDEQVIKFTHVLTFYS